MRLLPVVLLIKTTIHNYAHGLDITSDLENLEFIMDSPEYNSFTRLLLITFIPTVNGDEKEYVLNAVWSRLKINRNMTQQELQSIATRSLEEIQLDDSELEIEERPRQRIRRTVPDDFVSTNIRDTNQNDECAICYVELSTFPQCMLFECGHVFHCKCIRRWTSNIKNGCPTCRADIDEIIEIKLECGFGSTINSDIRYLKKLKI